MFQRIRCLSLLCLLSLVSACGDDDPTTPPADPAGSVRLSTVPAELDIGWTLSGPQGLLAVGAGDSLLTDLEPGEYTVSWTPRAGWIGAPDSTAALTLTGSLDFPAIYRARVRFADSPEWLLANFAAIYRSRDAVAYREMLHPAFRMALLDPTTQYYPELGAELDFAAEAAIHDHLFGGEPGRDWNDAEVLPVTGIDVQVLEPVAPWAPAETGYPFAGTTAVTCDARLQFLLSGYASVVVRGQLEFHAVAEDSLHLGVLRTHWRLAGLVDLTGELKRRGIEELPFGSVKAMWR